MFLSLTARISPLDSWTCMLSCCILAHLWIVISCQPSTVPILKSSNSQVCFWVPLSVHAMAIFSSMHHTWFVCSSSNNGVQTIKCVLQNFNETNYWKTALHFGLYSGAVVKHCCHIAKRFPVWNLRGPGSLFLQCLHVPNPKACVWRTNEVGNSNCPSVWVLLNVCFSMFAQQ